MSYRSRVGSWRVQLAAVAAAVTMTAVRDARADALTDLEKAHSAYVAHKYDDAETRLRVLLDAKALDNAENVADARMYLGAVLVAREQKDDAAHVFESLLVDRPEYQPDSLRVQLAAIDAFLDVRTKLRDRLAAAQAEKVRQEQEQKAKVEAEQKKAALRLAMLEKLAGEEVTTEKNSRLLAFVPFGVGQLQNGQKVAGWALLASESALAVGSGIAAAISYFDQRAVNDALARGDRAAAEQYHQRANIATITDYAFAGTFAATAIAGIVHAQITFVPERVETRKRDIPQVTLAPVVSPFFVGARATF